MRASFRLIGGNHIDQAGNTFGPGDVVETDMDLHAMFPGKFARVEPQAEPAGIPEKGSPYPAPFVGSSTTVDPESEPARPEPTVEQADDAEQDGPTETEYDLDQSEDVTKTFPTAAKNGFRVKQRGRYFRVYDTDGRKLNAGGTILLKKDVDPFVSRYLTD